MGDEPAMWIESHNPAHSATVPGEDEVPEGEAPEDYASDPGVFMDESVHDMNDGEPVTFNENGRAQVTDEVGSYLIDAYDDFERSDSSDGDADTEPENDSEDEETEDES